MRRLAKNLLPPIVGNALRRRFGTRLLGPQQDWLSAQRACGDGYSEAKVIARLMASAEAVLSGHAAWERDGFCFTVAEPDWRLLALLSAVDRAGPLRVVDVGGGMASAWTRNRSWLPLDRLTWTVVEQEAVVLAARKIFHGPEVTFTNNIDEALSLGPPDLMIFGSVLQYLEAAHVMLQRCLAEKPAKVLIDRTPFSDAQDDEVVIQRVPQSLGGGSYPAWIFARAAFLAKIPSPYRIFSDEITPDVCSRRDVVYRALTLTLEAA